MKLTLQVMIRADDGQQHTQELVVLEREDLQPETLGLTVVESKTLLRTLQEVMVAQQVQGFVGTHRQCPQCGRAYYHKDSRSISVRTVFGKVTVESPRFYHCSCQPHEQRTFSPVVAQLPERTTPELQYLETKFASLLSYGISTELLKDTLPVDEKLNPVTVRNHLLRVAQRTEDALGGDRKQLTATVIDRTEGRPSKEQG